jgi:hypothetical protein
VAVAALAGCGSRQTAPPRQPHLPRALATAWRNAADSVAAALAAGDGCLAQQRAVTLRAHVIRAVNARRVGSAFQESLLAAVNDLSSRIRCTPPPAPAPTPTPPPAPPEHGKHHGHGEHKGHGPKGGHD